VGDIGRSNLLESVTGKDIKAGCDSKTIDCGITSRLVVEEKYIEWGTGSYVVSRLAKPLY